MPTLTTNIDGGAYGLDYSAPNESWTIAKGVSVSAMFAVYSEHPGATLNNKGTVSATFDGTGVAFLNASAAAGDFVLKNQKSGIIEGRYGAFIEKFNGAVTVENKGTIEGQDFGLRGRGIGTFELDNTGVISAVGDGVLVAFSAGPSNAAAIENAGTIEADSVAINASSATGAKFAIHNLKGGTISAPTAIEVDERLVLKNEGKINGDIHGGGYGNTIASSGKIDGNVYLGSGDDKLVLKGKGKVTGLIDAGPGNDTVAFGKAADRFLFDSGLDALTNVTTFKNFASGKDQFFLDLDIFPTIVPGTLSKAAFHKGTAAADADDRIIYDKKSGALFYDADGNGGTAQVQFASLEKGTKLKASDFSAGEFSFLA